MTHWLGQLLAWAFGFSSPSLRHVAKFEGRCRCVRFEDSCPACRVRPPWHRPRTTRAP